VNHNRKIIQKDRLREYGFTLIELLVVISIIAVLASLSLPAITGALVKGQIVQTMSNYRQLYLLTQGASFDSQTSGGAGAFPGDVSNSIGNWSNALVSNYCSGSTFNNLISVKGKSTNTAVYAVGSANDFSTVFLACANLASNGVGSSAPYGVKGGAFVTIGGQAVTVTGTNALPLTNGIIWVNLASP
jgi:prepilin-type N-terminal cleavage/methylation domain-containing protein